MSTNDDVVHVVESLRRGIDGRIILPDDDDYDDARRVWNGMIERRPAAVIRAASTDDIAPVVRAVAEHGIPLAIRGGGHNVAGNGTVDGGIVLDLGGLTAVEVDPDRGTVRVAPGATLADVDRATEPYDLAVPVGVVSGTGMAGLTLGGGVGWLTRAYGLTADNLVTVDLVTASGEHVRASADTEPELFWGLRGGGGNFGVVSSFTFRAHPLGPRVFAGTFIYAVARMPEVLRAYASWTRDLPDALTSITTTMVPPTQWELGGEPLLFVGFVWAGADAVAGEQLVASLRSAAPPDVEVLEPVAWTAWQSQADMLFPKGVRAYWKNTSFDRLDDPVIDILTRRAAEQTWRGTAFDIHHMEGAYGRVGDDETPFPNRSARYWLNIYGYWRDPADDPDRLAFVRAFAADMEPHASGGQYVNFMAREERADARAGALAVYGPATLERLTRLKRRFDPDNLFRLNHNVPPA